MDDQGIKPQQSSGHITVRIDLRITLDKGQYLLIGYGGSSDMTNR